MNNNDCGGSGKEQQTNAITKATSVAMLNRLGLAPTVHSEENDRKRHYEPTILVLFSLLASSGRQALYHAYMETWRGVDGLARRFRTGEQSGQRQGERKCTN